MRMSDGVEWTLHCCTLLAALPSGQALPAAKLAEFHGVPPAYLAKHLQATTAAGITTSVAGPRGGYRLARPPAEITLLDVVLAVDGDGTAFRCSEIRQRGPVTATASDLARPCGIARAMRRAEDAWRAQLRTTTIADLVVELLATVAPETLRAGAEWVQQVEVRRGRHHDTRARGGGRGGQRLPPEPPTRAGAASPSPERTALSAPPEAVLPTAPSRSSASARKGGTR